MFSIIVPVKNGIGYTRAFLQSVREHNPDVPIEWVIVDSGSTDGTLDYCTEVGARVVPFRSNPFNYCAAVNAGAAAASGDLWIIANNDLEFRSTGDLARLIRLFADWPVLAVASPGRATGEAELEFRYGGVNGACWVVRPQAFRAWGGMPEAMSGYGYDEAYTMFQCWRHGFGFGWITGWDVFHHGSVTFGPEAGNVTPALRRNFSRLLKTLDAEDLDTTRDPPSKIIRRLWARELERAPTRLGVSRVPPDEDWLQRQGYANAKPVQGSGLRVQGSVGAGGQEPGARDADATVGTPWVEGYSASSVKAQWLPWLANELLLQPAAEVVGKEGWYAFRTPGADPNSAKAVGPLPPPLMAPISYKRASLRQRISAVVHAWRQRKQQLPDEW